MTPSEPLQDSEENREASNGNNGPDGTAPDSETQSSAASEDGGRTSEDGSRAPNDPAEGADF
ncbi:hypothetical protein HNV11_06515 [Spirosoma taeanense]|uniref:Uncharacterized protein n=1 Tax=Spirosoma taeanense TaxID=2735870 RepID=A0A6M5Y6N0_9BACT|nr:hypothetical protein [Spirosoma taeanense]QJW89066.1 hypothetical protein HNV11_06515 [Spirosoma taeanense]